MELQAKMQFITFTSILLSFGIIDLCSASISTYDGKPGCKTLGEIGNAYRHFWDPMRYFRCIALNIEPLLETCPDGSGFQQSLSTCVLWRVWKWEIPAYPPSCPNGVMCLSTEKTLPISLYPSEPYAPMPWTQSPAFINSEVGARPAWQAAGRPLVEPIRAPAASLQQLASVQPLASAQPLAFGQPLASVQPLQNPLLQLPTKAPQILYEPNTLTPMQPPSIV